MQACMNNSQVKTLDAVFSTPPMTNLEWRRIEMLLLALRCERIEGAGSRVRFVFNGHVLSIHRPHPAKEAKPYQVKQVKEYLVLLGVKR